MPKETPRRRRYTPEFKAEAVRLVVLHAWKRQHDPSRSNDRGETPEEELHRLRRENASLKRDRDALTKSIAVFVRDRK